MEYIVKDCMLVIKNNPNISDLFKNADEVINYHLNNEFSPVDFFHSLSILGGEEFARLLIFCIRHVKDQEDFAELLNNGVNEEFVNKLKFIVAKYNTQFEAVIDNINNPYGWKNLSTKVVKIGSSNFLDLEIELNNNDKFIIRDEPSTHIELFRFILEQIKNMKSTLSNEQLDNLFSELEELREEVKNFNE
jgi:hypothetical protein